MQINTSDGHAIIHNGEQSNSESPVTIGDHVWITSNTILTKGVSVADGCIIAQGAVVTKPIEEHNCLIGGVPAKIISTNIEWRK